MKCPAFRDCFSRTRGEILPLHGGDGADGDVTLEPLLPSSAAMDREELKVPRRFAAHRRSGPVASEPKTNPVAKLHLRRREDLDRDGVGDGRREREPLGFHPTPHEHRHSQHGHREEHDDEHELEHCHPSS